MTLQASSKLFLLLRFFRYISASIRLLAGKKGFKKPDVRLDGTKQTKETKETITFTQQSIVPPVGPVHVDHEAVWPFPGLRAG